MLDPFAGGGSILLEAQRLGLETYASDLNPVAVLINKALIEIPPKFAGQSPVNPTSREKYLHKQWKGAEGLAEDVRYYGDWMRNEAWKRIGHLYPKAHLPKEYGSGEVTVIAWLWARTITCPNPACSTRMPLVRSFWLSTKRGKEAWVEPIVDRALKTVRFEIQHGAGAPDGTVNRLGAKCIACGSSVPLDYVRAEGKARRMGAQMMAIVTEGKVGRIYLLPSAEQEDVAKQAIPSWEPTVQLSTNPRHMSPPQYGMETFTQLFTSRQLVALDTLSTLVDQAHQRVLADGDGDRKYADAVVTYLGTIMSKATIFHNMLARWRPGENKSAPAFGRQALQMVWDTAEVNPFAKAGGDFYGIVDGASKVIASLPATPRGEARQADATKAINSPALSIVSTDPPYYDNVPYSDLSDFFYVWLRRSIGRLYPQLFHTLLTPKGAELVADPFRHSGRESAERFFEEGLGQAFSNIREVQHKSYPVAVYYAFKQAETEDGDVEGGDSVSASTGWETMLEGLLQAAFLIDGTWPVRTEMGSRMRGQGSNALASSIVLVCRPRPADAPLTTRRDFLNALERELPKALRNLQHGNIAPVDLAQAAIGPGMAVFSRYSKVLESDGASMRVRTALQLINQTLDEVLAEQEGEYDADTRWAVAWFEQFGMEEGPYGVAETLSKAKNSAVGTLVEAGILRAQSGKVRLLRRGELSGDWNPATAKRLTVWEVTQRLIRALQEQGDAGAAAILDHVGAYGEVARDLAYRLYTICERKKWADEALAYNSLVVEWSDISGAAERLGRTTAEQARLFS